MFPPTTDLDEAVSVLDEPTEAEMVEESMKDGADDMFDSIKSGLEGLSDDEIQGNSDADENTDDDIEDSEDQDDIEDQDIEDIEDTEDDDTEDDIEDLDEKDIDDDEEETPDFENLDLTKAQREAVEKITEKKLRDAAAKSNAAFKKYKTENRDLKRENRDLKSQSQESRVDTEEVAALKQENEELKARQQAFDVKATTEYAEKVTNPMRRQVARLERIAKGYGLDEDATNQLIEAAAGGNYQKRNAVLEDLEIIDADAQEVRAIANQIEDIYFDANELEKNAGEVRKRYEEEMAAQKSESDEKRMKAFAASTKDTFDSIRTSLEVLEDEDGDLPDSIEDIREKAGKIDLTSASPKSQAVAVIAGLMLPELVKKISELDAEKKKMESSLSRRKAKNTRGTTTGKKAKAKREVDDGDLAEGMIEAIRQNASQGGGSVDLTPLPGFGRQQ